MNEARERLARPTFHIVKYLPEHKPALLKLQRQHWGPDDARNAAYFEWKFEIPSGKNSAFIYVAMQDRDVVGMCACWETTWIAGPAGKPVPMIAAGDMVVAREYRGLGLFERIAKFAEADIVSRGYKFLINLSAAPVTHIRSVRMGWRSVGAYRALRLQSTRPSLSILAQKILRTTPVLWRYEQLSRTKNAFHYFDKNSATVGRAARVAIGRTPNAAVMARIARSTEMAAKIALRRDEAHFSWRYQNPKHEYRFLHASNDASEAYMVLEARKGVAGRHVNIIDWESTDDGLKKLLLNTAIKAARADSLNVWSTPGGTNDHAFLFESGFREIDLSRGLKRYKPSVLIKPIGNAAKDFEQEFDGLDPLDQTIWNLQMTLSDSH